ncbi:MAG: hypothetical protein AUK47_16490 [Deltaproteobacteria bacterium CG2_30_63_29]|nr:MAG: hypothetical protein AUK47_16490 [Deltaproteobacteria bacterium CG2_30_63_29]PJB34733.1 MAG: hypothetical protein CO108_27615 [Deltaproteobacteria bacterium CG_4_9_14_3_um_filter_63_12]
MNRHPEIALLCFALLLVAACGEDPEECPSGGETIKISAPSFKEGFEFEIDRYEASRFDANAASEGSGREIACSMGGVQPWRTVSFKQASSACKAAGKRLCTRSEWIAACGSMGLENHFPYGRNYDRTACKTESVEPGVTGATPTCATQVNDIMDMSGNLREWVVGTGTEMPGLAGGGFSDPELNASCTNVISPSGGTDAYNPGKGDGFRCCK